MHGLIEGSEQREHIVLTYFFLRFISPAIIDPLKCGLLSEAPSLQLTQALIHASRLVQRLVNRVPLASGYVFLACQRIRPCQHLPPSHQLTPFFCLLSTPNSRTSMPEDVETEFVARYSKKLDKFQANLFDGTFCDTSRDRKETRAGHEDI